MTFLSNFVVSNFRKAEFNDSISDFSKNIPVFPSMTDSSTPLARSAITGVPNDWASTGVMPKSSSTDANMSAFACE